MKNLTSLMLLALFFSVSAFAGEKKAEIKVEGMTCEGCVNKVKTSLEKIEGVKSAEVSLAKSVAVVTYDDAKTNETALKSAVNSTGFKAIEAKAGSGKSTGCCGEAAKAGCCGK